MCNFDRRIIELLLTRLERAAAAPHLSDLAITATQETHGRERRFRYYTLANYRQDAEKQVSHPDYDAIDMSQTGNYIPAEESWFYETESDLNNHIDKFKLPEDSTTSAKGKAKATPKPPKPKVPKEPAPPKVKAYKNPILPDGSVKRGRPRKEWTEAGPSTPQVQTAGQKRKRGKKGTNAEVSESISAPVTSAPSTFQPIETTEPPTKKRRGRAPKRRTAQTVEGSTPVDRDAPMETGHDIQSQPPVAANSVPQMESVTEGMTSSISMLSPNIPQVASSTPGSNESGPPTNTLGGVIPTAGPPSHPTLQSAIVASTSAAAQSSLTDFHVDQEVAMQLISSISALSLPSQTQDVPIDPSLMQGPSVAEASQMMVCRSCLIETISDTVLFRIHHYQFPTCHKYRPPRRESLLRQVREPALNLSHQHGH